MAKMRGLLAALILLSTPALAEKIEWNPPARFDRPYAGELIEYRFPQPHVVRECARLLAHYGVDSTASATQKGCSAIVDSKRCIIVYIDKPYMGIEPEAVRRHEIGHCNGWPASHSD